MTFWLATVPTPEQFKQHALAHTSKRFADGRVGALWLLRPKALPEGWNKMSAAQRLRTGIPSARKLGDFPTVLETFQSAQDPNEWGCYQHDSNKPYNPRELEIYDWCPLTHTGEPTILDRTMF